MLTYLAFIILGFVVVSFVVLALLIVGVHQLFLDNLEKDRELNNRRTSYFDDVIEKIERILDGTNETQEILDGKMDALSRFIDERNIYVTNQEIQFRAFVKSDMLAARRDELVQVNNLKIALERIMSMTTMSRQAPAAIDVLALESVRSRIKELETILESDSLVN